MAIGRNEAISLITQEVTQTRVLYIDKDRTGTYIEKGGFADPFKTIQGAINQIIANGDNTLTTPYLLDFIGAAEYTENVTFNNAALVYVFMNGHGQTRISPAAGDAINSTSNNTNFKRAYFIDIIFGGSVNMQGDINATTFGTDGINFLGCDFNVSSQFNNIDFLNISYANTTTMNFFNITEVGLLNTIHFGTVSVETNAGNVPFNFTGSTIFIPENSGFFGSPALNIDTNSLASIFTSIIAFGDFNLDGQCFTWGGQILSNINVGAVAALSKQNTIVSGTTTITPGGVVNTATNITPDDITSTGTFTGNIPNTFTSIVVKNGLIVSFT